MLVSFDEFDELVIPGLPIAGQDTAREAVLEEELQNLRDQLNGSIGESTSSSEALRAANEELQSINEELRSTAEELETSKEELQSVNEELTTVNFELKGKVDEVAKVNDDLTNLIASMNIATIFVDRSTRIKRFTPIVGDLFNILATDVGRPLLDLTHRLAYPELRDDLWRVLETLRFVEREIAGEGDSRYLVRISPYRSNDDRIEGAVINFVDVTELHRAQQELRARDERLRLVVESTRDYAIVTLDSTGRVTGFNKGAELIFGYPEKEMLGEHFERLFVPEDRLAGVPESELQQARSEGRAADERWHLRKDGSRFFCSGITTLFADRSGPGFAKIARDLTERQRLERQRQELLDAEKQVRVRLEAAGAMRSEFLAIMSHELKNPLNLILMRVELLARAAHGREVPELQPSLDLIRRTVRAQSRIIDDLLDLSRVTTGKLALHRTPVKGLAVVARIVEAVLPESQSNGVALTLRGEDLTVLADEVRLEQMVWNLLSNALKFTKRGDAITVTLTREGSYAVLTVIDSGRGIEPSALRRIFEMFDQGGGKASTRREGGLGIGLALVKQLAELHDGRIEAHSDGPGFGARFTLSLPLFSTGPGAADAGTLGNGRMNGLRILLVEDDADTLEATRLLLTLEGAQVSATANAHDALAAAEGGVFDLVISDIGMPEMDGFELARRLRANTRSARWPVVAVSGFGSASDVARALEAGFSAHLPKPLAMEELDRAVGELLGTQRDPAAGAA
jgi:two-component system CheB/CheR fusion protein